VTVVGTATPTGRSFLGSPRAYAGHWTQKAGVKGGRRPTQWTLEARRGEVRASDHGSGSGPGRGLFALCGAMAGRACVSGVDSATEAMMLAPGGSFERPLLLVPPLHLVQDQSGALFRVYSPSISCS
jgi:hypothetical protein